MDHFENFKGFGVPVGVAYEGFYRESPVATACRVLSPYKGKDVEITCHGVRDQSDSVSNILIVPDHDLDIEKLFSGIDADFIVIDFPQDKLRGYLIQRIVIGTQSVSQVERDCR